MNLNYISAFKQWSGAQDEDFFYEEIGNHAAFLYKGNTYMVSSFDALKKKFMNLFEEGGYDDLYFDVNEGLWAYLFETEEVSLSTGDLIVAVYNKWRAYWYKESEEHKNNKEHIHILKDGSFQDLLIFIEAIKAEPRNIVQYAIDIDAPVFIPVVALIAKEEWGGDDDFYDTLVSRLVDRGESLLTDGDTFDEIDLDVNGEIEAFYIYNPSWEMEGPEKKPTKAKGVKKT